MVTLEEIKQFAIDNMACDTELEPFIDYIDNHNYKFAWQTVLGNLGWLNDKYLELDIMPILELADYTGITHFCSGEISYSYNYDVEGLIHSRLSFYNDGNTQSFCKYKNGVLHGTYTSYNVYGGKMMETEYLNGEENGIRIYYDVDGNIYLRYRYINGQRVCELLE